MTITTMNKLVHLLNALDNHKANLAEMARVAPEVTNGWHFLGVIYGQTLNAYDTFNDVLIETMPLKDRMSI